MGVYVGEVYHNRHVVGFFLYCSTTGYSRDGIYKTEEEARSMRDVLTDNGCTCGRTDGGDDVILYVDETGYGSHWAGKACLLCKYVIEGASYKSYKEWDGGYGMIEYITPPTPGKPV